MNSRAYVAGFNFKGSDQQKKVGVLSGGERNRVHLAKLLRRGGNVLLLDEPTNDLDVDTLRALEEALLAFPGCAVIISHDRWFLDRVATHVLAFEGDSQVHVVRGQLRGLRGAAARAARRRGRPPAPDHVQAADARVSATPRPDPALHGSGCPWAFSAERQRLRLLWLYGDQIDWELHMVVLSRGDAGGVRERSRRLPAAALQYGMPIDWRERLGVAPSVHACRAVVAVRLRWPEREAAMLRRLRVLNFAGELLDDSDTLELAAEQAGLPVAELAACCAAPEVEAALRADMARRALARRRPRARRTTSSAGPTEERRYTCPSYELLRDRAGRLADRARVDLPGFRPVEAYEAAIANLAPELDRRPDPRDASTRCSRGRACRSRPPRSRP